MRAHQPDWTRDEDARRVAAEARISPTRLERIAVATGATVWHLAVWLGVFASVCAALQSRHVRVVAIVRAPPAPTRALAALCAFAGSRQATELAALVVLSSLAAFALFRERPATRRGLLALATLAAAFFPAAFVALAVGFLTSAR